MDPGARLRQPARLAAGVHERHQPRRPKAILENQSGFDLYRSFDGENWVPVTTNGMDNPYNMGLRTMVSSPHGLFLGTANPFGPKIMPLGGDRYVPNPRGGCEIHFAPNRRG